MAHFQKHYIYTLAITLSLCLCIYTMVIRPLPCEDNKYILHRYTNQPLIYKTIRDYTCCDLSTVQYYLVKQNHLFRNSPTFFFIFFLLNEKFIKLLLTEIGFHTFQCYKQILFLDREI